MKSHPNSVSITERYLKIPGIIYLMVTLISGMWLRTQWLFPDWAIFTQKFTIHAHSHLAMLGWIFPVLLFVILKPDAKLSTAAKWFIGLLHFLIIAMFPAFVLQGYAFFSILFSSSFLTVSYIIIWLVRKDLDLKENPLKSLAITFYVLSTLGPWMLGGAALFGPEWLNAWIAFFLHLQFNGWVSFGLFSLYYKKEDLSKNHLLAFNSIAVSTFVVTAGYMFDLTTQPITKAVVIIAGFVLIASTVFLLIESVKHKFHKTITGFIIQMLLLKTLVLGFTGFDLIQDFIHHNLQVRVAFTHTSLLAIATTYLLFKVGLPKLYTLIFSTAAWLMVFLLWTEAFVVYYLLGIPLNIQIPYISIGLVLFICVIPVFVDSISKLSLLKAKKSVN